MKAETQKRYSLGRKAWGPNNLQSQFYLPTDVYCKPFIIIGLRLNQCPLNCPISIWSSAVRGPVGIHDYIYIVYVTTCR